MADLGTEQAAQIVRLTDETNLSEITSLIDTLSDATKALLVRSVLSGKSLDGVYRNLRLSNNGDLIVTALTGFGADFVFGDKTTAALTTTDIRRTPYVEQTTNGQRSVVSSSTLDVTGGTGARTVTIQYLDQAGVGPFVETVTLNGITAVNTIATNICHIEEMVIGTVGSTGANQGSVQLRSLVAGGGVTVGNIAATDNRTFWAHHIVPAGKECKITGMSTAHNGTTVGSGAVFFLRAQGINAAGTLPSVQVSDFVRLYGQASTSSRVYQSPINVVGPSRLTLFVTPETATSVIYRGGFDFFEP